MVLSSHPSSLLGLPAEFTCPQKASCDSVEDVLWMRERLVPTARLDVPENEHPRSHPPPVGNGRISTLASLHFSGTVPRCVPVSQLPMRIKLGLPTAELLSRTPCVGFPPFFVSHCLTPLTGHCFIPTAYSIVNKHVCAHNEILLSPRRWLEVMFDSKAPISQPGKSPGMGRDLCTLTQSQLQCVVLPG